MCKNPNKPTFTPKMLQNDIATTAVSHRFEIIWEGRARHGTACKLTSCWTPVDASSYAMQDTPTRCAQKTAIIFIRSVHYAVPVRWLQSTNAQLFCTHVPQKHKTASLTYQRFWALYAACKICIKFHWYVSGFFVLSLLFFGILIRQWRKHIYITEKCGYGHFIASWKAQDLQARIFLQ